MEHLKQLPYTMVFVASNVLLLTPRQAYANCSLRILFSQFTICLSSFTLLSLDYCVYE